MIVTIAIIWLALCASKAGAGAGRREDNGRDRNVHLQTRGRPGQDRGDPRQRGELPEVRLANRTRPAPAADLAAALEAGHDASAGWSRPCGWPRTVGTPCHRRGLSHRGRGGGRRRRAELMQRFAVSLVAGKADLYSHKGAAAPGVWELARAWPRRGEAGEP